MRDAPAARPKEKASEEAWPKSGDRRKGPAIKDLNEEP
jgi:hypothetical protein